MQFHEPEKMPQTDPVTQHIFDQGHLVGELAKKLFPDGIDIPADDFMGNISKTLDLLKERKTLFEAGILAGKFYSRIDILSPVGEKGWDIAEVKSSTSVKDVHINDVAYQRYCCTQFGLNINRCYLVIINNQYVKDGSIDPEGLFSIHDITDKVEEASTGIQDKVDGILDVINQETCPDMLIGPHCHDPYECVLKDCWEHLPEHNIFTLYYGGKKAFQMYDNGIITIEEIPNDYRLNDQQRIQKSCIVSGEPHVDKEAIRSFLSSLVLPLYYLDFETIGPAVPLFDGIRPYQDIPFQFSLHMVKDEFSKFKHFSFVASGTDDPRPALLDSLRNVIGEDGSILTYNKGFEEGCLRDMAVAFPEHSDWIAQVCDRLVDLLKPFANFHYYHPSQKGSASLKRVLPAITGKGYDDLDINDGQMASISFLTATFGDMPEAEKARVMDNLGKYCGRDTEGMIWIIDRLKELCI
ncbi:DUF2779 domain-containing protein [Chloroflexota bacterium]